ncbi:hypothetical protein U8D42_03260 [Mycobacterium europaeum]|uniref:hypothetical protein n=1 Tax=Mycobacterium europaeum TaxID=761804 RepID=UPI002AE06E6B|nr:hypothetical protein [Mycobacterium europaeum]MEA1159423.1 hypothetical protein [Mycobacterium europaeum]
MDSKFSVLPTIGDHYRTLVDQNVPGRPYWPDYIVLISLPCAAGAFVGWLFHLRELGSYIAGVAIFTALLFALVIYVFQLRVQLLSNATVPRDGKLVEFVDQLFANVNYAVVVGVIATAAAMIAATTSDDKGQVNGLWSGILTALSLHLMLVVFMCIKRVRAAYREIARLPRRGFISQ